MTPRERSEWEAALNAAALSWLGTPFCSNSCVKGAGVCCHFLVGAILSEAGWTDLRPEQLPRMPSNYARYGGQSAVVDWFRGAGAARFVELPLTAGGMEPGDLGAVRLGRVSHHLVMVLPGRRAIHVVDGHGVQVFDWPPLRMADGLVAVFRLKTRPWE